MSRDKIGQARREKKEGRCRINFEMWRTKNNARKAATIDEDDESDAILVDRGTLIARTEKPIEDVTTTRRF